MGMMGNAVLDCIERRSSTRQFDLTVEITAEQREAVLHLSLIHIFMERAYRNWDARVFEEYLHRFKLDSKKAIKELSRGMGMKLSLALSLIHILRNPHCYV